MRTRRRIKTVTPRQRGLSITATQTAVSVTYRAGPEIHRQNVFLDVELISYRFFLILLTLMFVVFCRYSNYRLHTGPLPANRSLSVSASHVLLLWLGTGGLHHLHCRWVPLLNLTQKLHSGRITVMRLSCFCWVVTHWGRPLIYVDYWNCKDINCPINLTENDSNKQSRCVRLLDSLLCSSPQFLQQLRLHSSCCQCASIWPDPALHRTSKEIMWILCL